MSMIKQVKDGLHPAFVMEQQGHDPVEVRPGKMIYHSPFRPDSNPSFDVYWNEDQQCWKFGDWASGEGGDVVDLLERFFGREESLAHGFRLMTAQAKDGWLAPAIPEATPFNPIGYEQVADSSLQDLQYALAVHLQLYPPDPAAWPAWITESLELYNRWGVRADGDTLRIPYHARDGELVGWKDRLARAEDNKRNAAGSKVCLYGLWRLTNDDRPIIIVEGETDTWVAQLRLGDGWIVLGLPGAGHPPAAVGGEHLAGRDVYLGLDPDRAGRDGVAAWLSYLQGAECQVAVVSYPEGKDVTDCTAEEFLAAVSEARRPSAAPPGFDVADGVYCNITRDGVPSPAANWSLNVERVLSAASGEQAYEGTLLPSERSVLLPAGAMHNQTTLTRWSSSHGVAWFAGGQAPQKLSALLQHRSLGLPTGRYTHQLGLNEGVFVTPTGYVGGTYYRWSPIPGLGSGRQMSDGFHLHDGPVSPGRVVDEILTSYDLRVSSVLLAWLAVAPLRTLFEQFPFLFVTGGKGSGKSTTPAAASLLMNGVQLREAASGSIHNIQQMVASNTSFPYQIDEFRANTMHRDKKAAFEDLLRLAYDGQPMPKGGQDRNNVSLVFEFELKAPIIISGENDIKDPAMRDRIVPVRFDRKMMRHVPDVTLPNLGKDYLRFLSDEAGADLRGGFIRPVPEGPKTLSERQRLNLGTIRQGWGFLADYLIARGVSYELPELDLGYVVEQFESAEDTNPLRTAVRLLLENPLAESVWSEGEMIHVRPERFLEDVSRLNTVDLPYDTVTRLKDHLADEFGATATRPRVNNVRVQAMSFTESVVN